MMMLLLVDGHPFNAVAVAAPSAIPWSAHACNHAVAPPPFACCFVDENKERTERKEGQQASPRITLFIYYSTECVVPFVVPQY